MGPIAWISLAFVLLLGSALCSGAALFLRSHAALHPTGRFYAAAGFCLNVVAWAAELRAAPGTNDLQRVYVVAAVLSFPSLVAAAVYVFSGARQRRRFDVTQPPPGGPGAV